MRTALAESLAAGGPLELYPRGAIVVCVSCGRPIYRLERSIGIGEKAGRAVSALAPVRVADLDDLATRADIDPGVRAVAKALTPQERRHYAETIDAPRAGHPAVCPKCGEVLVAGRTGEASDTIDQAYVLELHTVLPQGHAQARLRRGRV